jgi:uncharacterized protein (TIGR02145 family)
MIRKFIIYSIISILFWGCNKQTDKVDSNNVYHDDEDNNFSIGGSTKWSTTEITYSFSNSFPNKDNFKNAIRNAFLTWGNSSSSIKFKEINSNAEIRIEMGGIQHLGCPIDFEEDKLAHGFYPPPDQEYGDFAGDLHFYNKWNWTTDGTSNYDIETSALHEIGHILGLGHSSIQQSVMFRRYSGIRKTLSQDDKDAICQLYGCNNSTQNNLTLSGDFNFGSVSIGNNASKLLTISNTGSVSLTINSISLPAGFSGNWSGSINAGNSQQINITFTPTSTINYNGVLTVNSNAQSGINTLNVSGLGISSNTGNVIYDIDGNEYHEVQIGTQIWLKENLRTTRFPNGASLISFAPNGDVNNISTYGRLYPLSEINANMPDGYQGPCPNGYHIPSKTEVETLISFFNNNYTNLINSSDFNARLSGAYNYNTTNTYWGFQATGYYWTSTTNNPNAYKLMFQSASGIDISLSGSHHGMCIKCIKN